MTFKRYLIKNEDGGIYEEDAVFTFTTAYLKVLIKQFTARIISS